MQTEKIKPFVLPVVIGVLICLAAGLLGSMVTMPAVESMWFIDLNKPVFQPPNWLFAPVWTILYILMGVAAGIVYVEGKNKMEGKTALILFAVQLILNILLVIHVLWSTDTSWSIRKHCSSLGNSACNDYLLLQSKPRCRLDDDSIHPLGNVCNDSYNHSLRDELNCIKASPVSGGIYFISHDK